MSQSMSGREMQKWFESLSEEDKARLYEERRLKVRARAGECLFIGDGVLNATVIRTLVRLPDDVLDFVTRDCAVLGVGPATFREIWPANAVNRKKKYIIVISGGIVFKGDEEAQSFIAHQIAHAYLGHDLEVGKARDDHEETAVELVKAWGFHRTYKSCEINPEHTDSQPEYAALAATIDDNHDEDE